MSCGADHAPTDVTCTHCGSHLPMSDNVAKAAIFARIKASDDYARRDSAERLAKLPKIDEIQKVMLTVILAIFIGSSGVMVLVLLGMAGVVGLFGFNARGGFGAAFSLAPLMMAIFPLGFVVLGVFLFRQMKNKMNSLEQGPVRSLPAVVVDKRTHVTGGGDNHSARTEYFVTYELEDGTRKEYQVWDGQMYGRLTADDAGIVYVRSGHAVDFDQVRV